MTKTLYLQLQQLMFCGCFTSLGKFVGSDKEDYKDDLMSSSERKDYQQKASSLMIAWSWNGVDLPLFLLVLMSLFGVMERCLLPLVCLLALQFVLTIIYHQTQTQRLLNIGKNQYDWIIQSSVWVEINRFSYLING